MNAHAVTKDCTVFSHEQGSGAKNASSVAELILQQHILTCRGEGINVVVSDIASVGKDWLVMVALPQYVVDQGLAEIVFIVSLRTTMASGWPTCCSVSSTHTSKEATFSMSIDYSPSV